jgi:hypothetical protein
VQFCLKEISVTDLDRINKVDEAVEIEENSLYDTEKARRLSSGKF